MMAEQCTPVHGGRLTATTLETATFGWPHRVAFQLVRGPVPDVAEEFAYNIARRAADGGRARPLAIHVRFLSPSSRAAGAGLHGLHRLNIAALRWVRGADLNGRGGPPGRRAWGPVRGPRPRNWPLARLAGSVANGHLHQILLTVRDI